MALDLHVLLDGKTLEDSFGNLTIAEWLAGNKTVTLSEKSINITFPSITLSYNRLSITISTIIFSLGAPNISLYKSEKIYITSASISIISNVISFSFVPAGDKSISITQNSIEIVVNPLLLTGLRRNGWQLCIMDVCITRPNIIANYSMGGTVSISLSHFKKPRTRFATEYVSVPDVRPDGRVS